MENLRRLCNPEGQLKGQAKVKKSKPSSFQNLVEYQEHHKSNSEKQKNYGNLWKLGVHFKQKQSYFIFIPQSSVDFTYDVSTEKEL